MTKIMKSLLLPVTEQRLYASLFFLIPLLYFFSLPISSGDLAVWIAHGTYALNTGHILRNDIFSVLPTTELIYPVGTAIIYGFIFQGFGLIGVSVLHKLVVLLILIAWYQLSLKIDGKPWAGQTKILILFTWYGASLVCVDRPALLALLPLVISYWLIQKNEPRTWKKTALLVLLNLFWVNLHGSWILLLAMYIWRELLAVAFRLKRLDLGFFVTIGALIASSFCNPFSYKVFPYIFETARVSKERGIDEWFLPSLQSGPFQTQTIAFYLLSGLVLLYAFGLYRHQRAKFFQLVSSPFLLLILLGFTSIRNTALPFFVLIPVAGEMGFLEKRKMTTHTSSVMRAVNFLILLGTSIGLVLCFPAVKPLVKNYLPMNKEKVFDSSYPEKICNYLNQTPDQDPVFNDWEYGSILILKQKHKIFIDTRNIIYASESFEEYSNVINGKQNWNSILEKYHFKYLIVNKLMRRNLISLIEKSGRWSSIMEDENAVLYVADIK